MQSPSSRSDFTENTLFLLLFGDQRTLPSQSWNLLQRAGFGALLKTWQAFGLFSETLLTVSP